MDRDRIRPRLQDILDAIEGIRTTIAGLGYEQFRSTWATRRAVERGLEIISEASRHIPPDLTAAHPEIPWPKVRAIGNVLRHEYGNVEPIPIWNTATRDLDELEAAIRELITRLEKPQA